jgi:hypothetical protein
VKSTLYNRTNINKEYKKKEDFISQSKTLSRTGSSLKMYKNDYMKCISSVPYISYGVKI